jgi:hypothetical protein
VTCCQVLSLARCILIRIFTTLSDMSDGLITEFKRSNLTPLCCYENYMDVDDYFVVMAY